MASWSDSFEELGPDCHVIHGLADKHEEREAVQPDQPDLGVFIFGSQVGE